MNIGVPIWAVVERGKKWDFCVLGQGLKPLNIEQLWRNSKNEPIPSIRDAYKNPSCAKVSAYDECTFYASDYVDFLRARGYKARLLDWGVISHNSCFFTFAAIVRMSDIENGLDETDVAIIMKPSGDKFEVVL